MTFRIGAKGQVVIPKPIRDAAALQPGDPVEFELRGGEVVMRRQSKLHALRGRFAGSDMAARLLEDRAREPR